MSEPKFTLPEIYKGCAHPQSVWFEEHWRPVFEAIAKECEALKYERDIAVAANENNFIALAKQNAELREDLRVAVDFLVSIEKEKCTTFPCGCPTHAAEALEKLEKYK